MLFRSPTILSKRNLYLTFVSGKLESSVLTTLIRRRIGPSLIDWQLAHSSKATKNCARNDTGIHKMAVTTSSIGVCPTRIPRASRALVRMGMHCSGAHLPSAGSVLAWVLVATLVGRGTLNFGGRSLASGSRSRRRRGDGFITPSRFVEYTPFRMAHRLDRALGASPPDSHTPPRIPYDLQPL